MSCRRRSIVRPPRHRISMSELGWAQRSLALILELVLAGHLLMGWPDVVQAQAASPTSADQDVRPDAGVARFYDTPAGPLSSVLTRFSTEAGIFLVGASKLAQGKTSPGVQGNFTVQVALDMLLTGTRAEAILAAADANVAAARAAMLPRLTLGVGVGTQGGALRRLLDNPAYALVAGLTAPIFDASRLAAERDGAPAQREALLAGYRQAIVAAFADVEVALNAVASLAAQAPLQVQQLTQAQRGPDAGRVALSRRGRHAAHAARCAAQRVCGAGRGRATEARAAALGSGAVQSARWGLAGRGRKPYPRCEGRRMNALLALMLAYVGFAT